MGLNLQVKHLKEILEQVPDDYYLTFYADMVDEKGDLVQGLTYIDVVELDDSMKCLRLTYK